MVIVGIDPHPGHHTAAALDAQGRKLATESFMNNQDGLMRLVEWLATFDDVRLAVEGPTQPFFLTWATRLMAEGYPLVPVPPQRTARARRSRAGKSDEGDASHIAAVLLAETDLPALAMPKWLRPLQELVHTRLAIATDLKVYRMRAKGMTDTHARESIEHIVTLLADEMKRLEQELHHRILQLAPQLLDITGVGTVIAGMLLAETGNPARFRSPHAFASYCGAAPVLWQSGAQHRVRVNHRGNRRLNWALHMVVRTRTRYDQRTKAFLERKEREGKGKRGAIRALKTYIARELFDQLKMQWSSSPALAS